MKLIFLDFDGVLNNREWLMRTQNSVLPPEERYFNNPCSPKLVVNLQKIVDATGALIVFSTSWRIRHTEGELIRYMLKAGFQPRVRRPTLGKTPRLWRTPEGEERVRGHEIDAWLTAWQSHGDDVESFVILDDDSDMVHLKPRLVQTDGELGLTEADAEKAVKLLNEGC